MHFVCLLTYNIVTYQFENIVKIAEFFLTKELKGHAKLFGDSDLGHAQDLLFDVRKLQNLQY